MKRRLWPYHLILVVVALYLVIPIVATLVYSFTTSWVKILPSGWTLKYWVELITEKPVFWQSIIRSFVISVIPIFITTVIIIMAMYVVILYIPALDTVIQSICMIPFTLRGVILAISVLGLYAGKGIIFSNRMVMLVCIYCVGILPYVYRGIRNNLYAINVRQILEAAELLGASGLYTFFRIIVPNMLSGILVSALLSLGSIFTDYAVVKIIAGSRYITAQSQLYTINKTIGGPIASVVVIVMFTTTLLIAVASYKLQNKSKSQSQAQE